MIAHYKLFSLFKKRILESEFYSLEIFTFTDQSSLYDWSVMTYESEYRADDDTIVILIPGTWDHSISDIALAAILSVMSVMIAV